MQQEEHSQQELGQQQRPDGHEALGDGDQHGDHGIITIEVDGTPYRTRERRLTGAQIKALAKKPPGNLLYQLEGRRRVEISNTELIQVEEGDKFMTAPPVGGAS